MFYSQRPYSMAIATLLIHYACGLISRMVLQGIGDNMRNLRVSNIIMFSILILSGFAQATDIHDIDNQDEIFPVIIDGLPPLTVSYTHLTLPTPPYV